MTTDWIRPWWPGRDGDHIRRDCPLLNAETDNPTEGAGWLDPKQADQLCPTCFAWDATCTKCYASLAEEKPLADNVDAAQDWADEHVCPTSFDYAAVVRPAEPVAPMHGQPALFSPFDDMIRLTAVEATR